MRKSLFDAYIHMYVCMKIFFYICLLVIGERYFSCIKLMFLDWLHFHSHTHTYVQYFFMFFVSAGFCRPICVHMFVCMACRSLLKRKYDVILPKMAEPVVDRFAMARNVYISTYFAHKFAACVCVQISAYKYMCVCVLWYINIPPVNLMQLNNVFICLTCTYGSIING